MDFHIRLGPGGEGDQERVESAWKQVEDVMEYRRARPGDYTSTPFECDLCIFIKLQNRYPSHNAHEDIKLLACIRRANLDAFWSRASTAVGNNARTVKRMISSSNEVGLSGPFTSCGPMPDWDYCGYQVAIDMLIA